MMTIFLDDSPGHERCAVAQVGASKLRKKPRARRGRCDVASTTPNAPIVAVLYCTVSTLTVCPSSARASPHTVVTSSELDET